MDSEKKAWTDQECNSATWRSSGESLKWSSIPRVNEPWVNEPSMPKLPTSVMQVIIDIRLDMDIRNTPRDYPRSATCLAAIHPVAHRYIREKTTTYLQFLKVQHNETKNHHASEEDTEFGQQYQFELYLEGILRQALDELKKGSIYTQNW
ncbi:MAG: hypothetical protein Q9162_005877 [Coniocarpon cinnabarinum]